MPSSSQRGGVGGILAALLSLASAACGAEASITLGAGSGSSDAAVGSSLDATSPAALPPDAAVAAPSDAEPGETASDAASETASDAASEADAPCVATIASPPLLPAVHVAIGSAIDWDSNPPSSGPHYPVWAAYQVYEAPVPRGYYVHDLEHGAIVLAYNCGAAGCPNVVAAFEQVVASLPDDPLCTSAGEGVRVRFVITPDPLLDVPVAAAAWGWTYKAACIDLPSLEAFAAAHYGQGPEDFCTDGTTQF